MADAERACGRADETGGTVSPRVVALMEELRGQGYSFRDIAAALEKQGIGALSSECIKFITEAHQTQKR